MDFGRSLEKLMRMDDVTWKRHANPWSVWTRFAILPLIVLAIWSRTWFGWWSLLPIVLLIVWTFVNPRAFPKPETTKFWACKATFGERVWLKRAEKPIPAHHVQFANALSVVTALAVVPLAYGLITYEPMVTCLSLALVIAGKLWFLDRMVWLYEDMKDSDPEFTSWLY